MIWTVLILSLISSSSSFFSGFFQIVPRVMIGITVIFMFWQSHRQCLYCSKNRVKKRSRISFWDCHVTCQFSKGDNYLLYPYTIIICNSVYGILIHIYVRFKNTTFSFLKICWNQNIVNNNYFKVINNWKVLIVWFLSSWLLYWEWKAV